MNTTLGDVEKASLHRLRLAWGFHVAGAGVGLLLAFFIFWSVWEPWFAGQWLILAGSIAAYQFAFLWRHLRENRPDEERALFPTLGWANHITILRGVLLAGVAGFLFSPRPSSALAWIPGVLYLIAASMDLLDGYLARITHSVSELGAKLDMEWDSLGFLIAVLLGVFYGQIQAGYILLGTARFFFVAGISRRERRGQPVYELDDSMVRRALAGLQMGFVAVVLLPVFSPLVTQAASMFFMLPSLAHFWRDWLWVSGQIGRQKPPVWRFDRKPWRFWLPLGLRATLILLVGITIWVELTSPVPRLVFLVLGSLAIPALVLGAAGRVVALVVLLMSGFLLQGDPSQALYWLVMLDSIQVLIVGTGPYSLWSPENGLIYHRAGEAVT